MRCVLTTTTRLPRTVVLCGAALLLATTACAEGHGKSPMELSEMIAESVRDSADTRMPGLGVAEAHFEPDGFSCDPAVDPEVPGLWRSHAPRETVIDEASVELGLIDADHERSGTVFATVTDPEGGTATAEAELASDEWTGLVYPDDFDADPLRTGVYTVIWSDAAEGARITCDGFEVD